MTHLHPNEQDYRQDTLRRIQSWLDLLEERITTLLSLNEPESLKPGEREQAVSRYLPLLLRLLQHRQAYAEADPATDEQTLLEKFLHDLEEA